jgi:outer membrane protein assembly factor BamB
MRQLLTMATAVLVAVPAVTRVATIVQAQVALTPAWTLEGPYTDVAADEESGAIYGLGEGGRVVDLDASGQIQRELRLPDSDGDELRLARLPGPALLTFSLWTSDLRAYDRDGQPLWTYPRATGIENVWAGDVVAGDRSDEVIVGYSGRTGMHVLDGRGRLRWESTSLADVWHIAAGDVLGEGTPQVVGTAAGGLLHIFGSDGTRRLVLDPGFYAQMVRVSKPRPTEASAMFVAGTSRDAVAGRSMTIAALSGNGAKIWKLDVPDEVIFSASAAAGGRWFAFSTRSGRISVVDAVTGRSIGQVQARGPATLAWAETDSGSLLVVATGTSLIAFPVPNRTE